MTPEVFSLIYLAVGVIAVVIVLAILQRVRFRPTGLLPERIRRLEATP